MRWTGSVVVGLLAVACGGAAGKTPETAATVAGGAASPRGPVTASGTAVAQQAAKGFEEALATFGKYDQKGEWSESACKDAAAQFLGAAERQQDDGDAAFPEAHYNAGLVYQRCGDDALARQQFEAAVKAAKGFHRAQAQLALYEFAKSEDLDRAIANLEQIIKDAKFQNVEALVSLAALQTQRASGASGEAATKDYTAAKQNIQRALALDDAYMPAFNQLAIYYLELARVKAEQGQVKQRRGRLVVAGGAGAALDRQQLELAELVTAQAVAKNAQYAPIQNTAGLIQVEQRNFNGAVKSFGKARALDPKLFEAHMNYGAVSLMFRGFAQAEDAYRAALKLRPATYEAELGLALALRGQIDDSTWDKLVAETEQHLAAAKRLAPERPETYYNEAILIQGFRAKVGELPDQIARLKQAASTYEEFIRRAGEAPEFADAVKRSRDRLAEMPTILKFLEGTIEAQRAAAAAPPPVPATAPPPVPAVAPEESAAPATPAPVGTATEAPSAPAAPAAPGAPEAPTKPAAPGATP